MKINFDKYLGVAKQNFSKGNRISLLGATLGMVMGMATMAQASVAIWQYQVLFNEFEGQGGGFENEGIGVYTYNKAANGTGGPSARGYDFLQQTGSNANGKPIYGVGQDGTQDLQVTSRLIDGTGGRWTALTADKREDDLRGNAILASGKSRPGDYGIIAYEFCFSADLGMTAKDLGVRLTNVNGFGEIYQWSFVTLGGVDDAPFSLSDVANYRNTDYTNVASGTFYNADGTPSGAPGTGQKLAEGKSISQYLAGQPGQTPAGGVVQPGWYANDDFHVNFQDGPEAPFTNPTAGFPDASKPDTLTVRGVEDLGLDGEGPVTKLTVWLGYMDVGFDSNGDGFSSTGATQRAMISYINIGASDFTPLPEPTTTMMTGLVALGMFLRRRR